MAESGSFSADDSALRLRLDAKLDPLLAVHYKSAVALIRDVFHLYGAHFRPLVVIYLLPVVPFALLGSLVEVATASGAATAVMLTFFAGTFAFAAMAVAVSDVCSGNRPGVRRAYRRIFGLRFGVVMANTILYYLAISIPVMAALMALSASILLPIFLPVAALIIVPAVWVSVRYMFVPVISAIEPRPGVRRAFARSAWLSKGHCWRAFGMLFCVLAVGALLNALIGSVLPDFMDVVIATVIFPPFYIAIVLQYYDLRARKEGFRVVELPEDIT